MGHGDTGNGSHGLFQGSSAVGTIQVFDRPDEFLRHKVPAFLSQNGKSLREPGVPVEWISLLNAL